MKQAKSDPIINRYECPKCGQVITLYGGETDGTSVICEKCGVWMQVGNPHGIPKIISPPIVGAQAFDYTHREFNSSFYDPEATNNKKETGKE